MGIGKIVPKSIKARIKRHLGGVDEQKANRIFQDILERRVAAEVETKRNHQMFTDKVVVVTGASGHIGSCICLRFAQMGATVIACGRSVEKIEKAFPAEFIESKRIIPLALELTNPDAIEKGFAEIYERYSQMDVLVNCAGGSSRDEWKEIKEQSNDIIREIISTNLTGTILCAKYAARYMAERNSGRIINISSTVGVGGKAGFSEYAASKAGVIGFTRSLAIELGKYGITVNCVTPGVVNRGGIELQKIDSVTSKNVMASFGIDNDIASAVTFFASNEANFITGQNLVVDGGRSLGLKGD